MQICQYEFQFFDEFMEVIEEKVSRLLNINSDDFIRKEVDNITFVLEKATENNYMLFAAHKSSYVYVVIIRCDAIHEKEIQKLLFDICEKIEECYDKDNRKMVVNVFGKEKTHLKYLEENYKVSSLFDICVD